jgi:hypothetical protein
MIWATLRGAGGNGDRDRTKCGHDGRADWCPRMPRPCLRRSLLHCDDLDRLPETGGRDGHSSVQSPRQRELRPREAHPRLRNLRERRRLPPGLSPYGIHLPRTPRAPHAAAVRPQPLHIRRRRLRPRHARSSLEGRLPLGRSPVVHFGWWDGGHLAFCVRGCGELGAAEVSFHADDRFADRDAKREVAGERWAVFVRPDLFE